MYIMFCMMMINTPFYRKQCIVFKILLLEENTGIYFGLEVYWYIYFSIWGQGTKLYNYRTSSTTPIGSW